jgi:hypothetical protein
MVPTTVVTREVSTVVNVVVSKTCVFATEVEVVASVFVTVAVGILSNDEQKEVAVGAPLRLLTTAVAAAKDSRRGAK